MDVAGKTRHCPALEPLVNMLLKDVGRREVVIAVGA